MEKSENVLHKCGLRSLNEIVASSSVLMVWKAKKSMNPLGKCLFPERSTDRPIRSMHLNKATQPVPGNRTLATNLMAKAWNSAQIHDVETLGAAKIASRKWASGLLKSWGRWRKIIPHLLLVGRGRSISCALVAWGCHYLNHWLLVIVDNQSPST